MKDKFLFSLLSVPLAAALIAVLLLSFSSASYADSEHIGISLSGITESNGAFQRDYQDIVIGDWGALSVPMVDDADLAIQKVDDPDPGFVGLPLTYTITITNLGPTDATTVKLDDTLPKSVNLESIETSQGTCSGNKVLHCSLGDLLAGSQATVTIVVIPQQNGVITNQADVSSSVNDLDLSNNATEINTTIVPRSDLEINKTDDPDPAFLGESLTYVVTVANLGPSESVAVILTDTLPASVNYVAANPTQGTCEAPVNSEVVCSLGTITESQTVDVAIEVIPTAVGNITNQAVVTSSTADWVPGNNSTAEDTLVEDAADLAIQKGDDPDPVFVDDALTYTIRVTNLGPSDADSVIMTDTLPGGVTYGSVASTQGTCAAPVNAEVVCDLGTITVGSTVTVTIDVTPNLGGAVTNAAEVSASTADLNLGNNNTTEDTTVQTVADVAVAKEDDPDPIFVNETLFYTVTVTNLGPNEAGSVVVTDTLPAGVTFGTATPSQGNCSDPVNLDLVCDLGTIAAASSATVLMQVTPTTAGIIKNNAVVSTTSVDPVAGNNNASANTTVDDVADLFIQKTDSADPAYVGYPLTYTVSVVNQGQSTASSVIMTDTLPVDVVFVEATPAQGTCEGPVGLEVVCDLGTVASGETVNVELVVTPTTAGNITNNAVVSSTVADLIQGNNTAAEETVVEDAADLSLLKLGDPDPVLVDHPLTYTLQVSNLGPSTATGVVLTDTLPLGVSIVEADFPGCTIEPSFVFCQVGQLAVGESQQILLSGIVEPSSIGPALVNHVEVGSSVPDPFMSNNTDSVSTLVQTLADIAISQTDNPDPVNSQEVLEYSITINNYGPSDALNLTLDNPLDSGVTFVSSLPGSPDCSYSNHAVHCELGNLGAGQAMVVKIYTLTKVDTVGTLLNRVYVSSDTDDPNPINNLSDETTEWPDDVTPPSVEWVAPTTYAQRYDVQGEVVRLVAQATDDIAVDYVRFYRWDAVELKYKHIGIDESPPYQWDFNTSVLNPAWNEIRVEVFDTAGNHAPESAPMYIWLYYTPTLWLPFIVK